MLGWFKKKFKKSVAPAPVEETVVEELTTDTSFSEHEQDEKESAAIVETIVEEQPPIEELEKEQQKPVAPEDQVPFPEVVPEIKPVVEPEVEPEVEPTPVTVEELTISDEVFVAEQESELDSTEEHVISEVAKEPLAEQEIEPKPEPVPAPEVVPEPEFEPDLQAEAKPEDDFVEPLSKQIEAAPETTEKKRDKKSLFSRLSDKLSKTRETFTYQIDALFLGKKVIDEDMLDDLEEVLITADLGVGTTQELLEYARREVKRKEMSDPESLKKVLKKRIAKLITDNEADATLVMPKKGPFVIMVIGVNGVGKTTTIGKIANKFVKSGQSVMLVAGDTFRAAAVSQLKIWGERNNVPVVSHKDGADPSAVVFDALGIATAQNVDVVLVDTAGRLHTQDNLMEELKKIKRVMSKKLPGAPHETMLVIDATTGQNGISQARLFDAAVDVTGLALTKLDGTSKGGIVANICREMKIPIRFIGIGEQMDDLRDFDANEFTEALFHSTYGKHNQ